LFAAEFIINEIGGCKLTFIRKIYLIKIFISKGALNFGIKKGGRTPGSALSLLIASN